MPACRLEAVFQQTSPTDGEIELTLTNFSGRALKDFRLAFASLTRSHWANGHAENGNLIRRVANFHEYAPPADTILRPGAAWTFRMIGLSHLPKHRTGGPKTAYLILADETTLEVECGDLLLKGAPSTSPAPMVPEGRVEIPLSILPWPKSVAVSGRQATPVALYPAEGSAADAVATVAEVAALARRLFPDDAQPLSLVPVPGGLAIDFTHDAALAAEAYRLTFATGVMLTSSGTAGRLYGLIALAQILHGARTRPDLFAFPVSGTIDDAPRYAWRGCHLDVSRQFYPLDSVKRLIDILAWNRLNVFHWHLTDDEGWRLEIKGIPELVAIGSKRGHREKMVAQPGSAAETYAGHYTQDEVKEVIAQASALNVDIVPEFDLPGHCTAVLHALPHLVDPREPADSYRSVQGYPNNALNPALPQTYAFLEKVLGEIADLFSSRYVHIGGDEVAGDSWLASPAAQELMQRENIHGTFELQAHLLKRVKKMLDAKGKKLAGWDEVSHGGGVPAENTLLMAWQKPEVALELARQGYEIVITPGQAYYLDMVQADDWMEPGTSWAGTVPPKKTYEFEAVAELPADLGHRLRGVQACIWSENLTSKALFNHMVFPRLSAIAEAAWTPREAKNWLRFAAISHLMPKF